MRLDHASRSLPQEWDMTPEEWDKYKRDVYDQQPWFRGVTDKQGQTDIQARYTSLDRTSGSKPPSWKDFVTGKQHQIKVSGGESPEEELNVVMEPGASVKGKSYIVTVIGIQEPQYFETQ
jgi:hypothetical protein